MVGGLLFLAAVAVIAVLALYELYNLTAAWGPLRWAGYAGTIVTLAATWAHDSPTHGLLIGLGISLALTAIAGLILQRRDDVTVRVAVTLFGVVYIGVPMAVLGAANGDVAVRDAIRAFHRAHDDRFGYAYEGKQPVEIVNVGATGFGLFPPLVTAQEAREECSWEAARREIRRGVFRGVGEVGLPVYERSRAPLGVPVNGPCIIEQYDATLVVEPGWRAELDGAGQILLTHLHQEA